MGLEYPLPAQHRDPCMFSSVYHCLRKDLRDEVKHRASGGPT